MDGSKPTHNLTHKPTPRPRYVRGASPELHQLAREHRANPTPAEAALWAALRGHRFAALHFRFQHPVGQFILDFYCAAHKLVLEVDGGIHDQLPEKDAARTAHLEAYHYQVLRFRNEEVLTSLPTVLARILAEIAPQPPPH
jgi:very-short-patch-repair endonuclease